MDGMVIVVGAGGSLECIEADTNVAANVKKSKCSLRWECSDQ